MNKRKAISLLFRPVNLNLAQRLTNESFRKKFFLRFAKKEVAAQIRQLRERRELTQVQFAKICKMGQSAVSRIEDGDYSGWTFKTLAKVAEKMDAQLRITLTPSEDVIGQYWAEEGQGSGGPISGTGERSAIESMIPQKRLGEQQERPRRPEPSSFEQFIKLLNAEALGGMQ